LRVQDIGLWELNEAFAVQVLYCRDQWSVIHGVRIFTPLTFAANESGQLYIVPHQKILDLVAVRMQDIVAQRNPTDCSVLTPG